MRPLIGIPPALDERGRWRPGRAYHYIDRAYASAVEAAGGVPLYLPAQAEVQTLAERIDGLLLPGGDDFAPDRPYPPEVRFDPVPESQLDFDARLLDAALALARPFLGICYGMQLLARLRGGSLLYHLPSDRPAAGSHQLEAADRHELHVEPGTRLAAALGDAAGPVNSRHHQAVDEPGRGLRVSARAGDGVIEAIEAEAGPFCLGVQWHPEGLDGEHRQRLFSAFVDACRDGA